MQDFDIDLLDFEINELNNTNSDIKQENLLDFDLSDDIIKNNKTYIEELNSDDQIKKKIFPDDDEMPPLDEDIRNVELADSESTLPNSIQPLTDADVVFNSNSIDEKI